MDITLCMQGYVACILLTADFFSFKINFVSRRNISRIPSECQTWLPGSRSGMTFCSSKQRVKVGVVFGKMNSWHFIFKRKKSKC